ncbi:MAG: DNA mismatch repair protein mutL [Candidatus Parvibacillus calidus]|nr:MAG: DNA mismatch repair protein mutL [Candidatus Parvibacillus calidus]WKZ62250.1 MAG: DNA mismatch repair endonuclease MutL [Saprospiraceae bacterium]
MSDRIKLLPEVLANQIAAGEVVQRPASVVKELMENAIDAGATNISLILKDGGKMLISVIDNGVGMSPVDARMSFERHATSKLSSVKDLFAIRTMGFRGEALASIAAVAQVEMTTKRAEDEVATRIVNEGNKITTQEATQAPTGTTIAVRNLFFNIPARRAFLKSTDVERRHTYEEFIRLALAHPDIRFQLVHNDEIIHFLEPSNLKLRVVNLFKNDIDKRLLSVEEETDKLKIFGVIGTPQQSRKTRGDQYLFVNHRFIKSPLLNHAITSAYDKIIPSDHFPFYILFLELDPATIDVNVHPTKQEIKFDDEHIIYTYLKAAVKHTLSYNLVAPTLDFEKDEQLSRAWNNEARSPHIPPANPVNQRPGENYRIPQEFIKENVGRWKDLYENIQINPEPEPKSDQPLIFNSSINEEKSISEEEEMPSVTYLQVHRSYIIFQVKSGLMIIDQHNAHHRILYEQFYTKTREAQVITQTNLFPTTLYFDVVKADLLKTILDQIGTIGFDIEISGTNEFIVHGYPSFLAEGMDLQGWFDELIDTLYQGVEVNFDMHHVMAMAYADRKALPRGKELKQREISELVDQLFACTEPSYDARGNSCFGRCTLLELEKIIINKK